MHVDLIEDPKAFGAALPAAGGPGTKAFIAGGAVLTVTAVLGYAWKADKLTLRRKP